MPENKTIKEINRLLHMDSDIPSIYFPAGKIFSGGSCYYTSKKCLAGCPSGGETNKYEIFAFNFFKDYDSVSIVKKILDDFYFLIKKPISSKIIQWFAWGDCIPEMEEKIKKIILQIEERKIPQYGFTRNRNLWEMVPKKDNLRIGFSIDNLKEAKKESIKTQKLICNPDYEHGYGQLIFDGEIRARCNGWWCKTKTKIRNSDCIKCLLYGEGCYFRIK